MKPFTIIGAAMLLLVSSISNAQFLNKLKKKAQAAVTNAVTGNGSSTETTTTESTEDNASEGAPATSNSPSAPSTSAAAKYGTQLFTLEKGEYLVYGELSLSVKADGTHVKAVTRLNRQFYLYDNGARSGPYATPPVDKLDDYKRDYEYQKNTTDEYMTKGMSYISAGNLVVDGKKYGQVLMVSALYHNPKTKKFYAIAVKNESDKMNYYLISDKGSRKILGVGLGLIVSANGESGGVLIPATQYNAKTEQDMYNFVANDDSYIVLANGKTLGPYKYVDGTRNQLDDNSNYVQVGKSGPKEGVFVNGKQIISFNEGIGSSGTSFVSADGNNAAWFERGNLLFSDGTFIKGNAIQPAASTENGVKVLNWVMIEKQHVYHCKKEL
ncbi:MAG: hypothetical protein EOP54_27615 [Sphingobacteriales bacterium]|nr:MAG: hypothetical protein EOP54_27615 [Sphingobacteriales bacterium]